ncbi:hypothetical protein BT67DRAFT_440770 [Trichocladium antarcticum]|uniref:Uncharacterized protein n=1 Tax=Trichocladium antarcticum TaxID=1450529 RepID=A0AAN6ZFS7_9PEZI|nr:hypothetical protein BT67DRAFT_440770 [Trichocladium antarcticum]
MSYMTLSRHGPRGLSVQPVLQQPVPAFTATSHKKCRIQMKTTASAAVLLGLVSAALAQAQTPGPSPTESVGCEPHGDHWHCDGPRVTSAAAPATSSAVHHDGDDGEHGHGHDEDDGHSDAPGTASLKPSPTESYGCEPHGDHWHCQGAITASTAPSASPSAHGTASLKPSPTESYGCEPHGDHWHCQGAITASTAPSASISANGTASITGGAVSNTPVPGMAAGHYPGAGLGVAGLVVVVAMAV